MAETWIINEAPNVSSAFGEGGVFSSNNRNFLWFGTTDPDSGSDNALFFDYDSVYTPSTGWIDEAYRTVSFESAPTGAAAIWLQTNAEKQGRATSTNILMHPIVDGQQDKSVNLYPKTKVENVIGMPTKVSQFENDSNFITSAALDPYAKQQDLSDLADMVQGEKLRVDGIAQQVTTNTQNITSVSSKIPPSASAQNPILTRNDLPEFYHTIDGHIQESHYVQELQMGTTVVVNGDILLYPLPDNMGTPITVPVGAAIYHIYSEGQFFTSVIVYDTFYRASTNVAGGEWQSSSLYFAPYDGEVSE